MENEALAMVFEKVGQPFSPMSIQLPELGKGEILVKIAYTTICSSDLHTFYGRRCGHTGILGHEIMGHVVGTAKEGVTDFSGEAIKIGDRVTWSVYAYDPTDKMARMGIPQKSKSLFKYGHEKLNEKKELSGGFATHCLLKAGTSIFKLPDNITVKEAAPLNCTHATIAGAMRLAENLENKNVGIMGVGMLGLSACAMAKEKGAKKVIAMDIAEKRLQYSTQFGADITIRTDNPFNTLLEMVSENGGLDVIVDTSGIPSAIEMAIKMLNIGGTCVLVGSTFQQKDFSVNAETIVRNLLTIKGLHNYIPEDLGQAISFVSKFRTKYPFADLVGEEYPLSELDRAFEVAEKGQHYRLGISLSTKDQ
ncbi:zinc-binding dehydrogenase [Fulvivirgaceae bacterium BMA12]|uniref:alcohol dehydrogenase n=1 Tax=Agaribacillus aureus TaxID=3051825 RepID=A0ABT8LE18_9BACT|nr:zinc-binding dehydrogenase [Fulvivirgaceae bacterium BMA12]